VPSRGTTTVVLLSGGGGLLLLMQPESSAEKTNAVEISFMSNSCGRHAALL